MIHSGLPVLLKRDGEDISIDAVELTHEELDEHLNGMNDKQVRLGFRYLLNRLKTIENDAREGMHTAVALVNAFQQTGQAKAANTVAELLEAAAEAEPDCYSAQGWVDGMANAAAAGRL